MSYIIQGHIKHLGGIERFGQNGFSLKRVAVETSEQYPQVIEIQFVKNDIEKLNGFAPGQLVKIAFNIRGKEHSDNGSLKIFNTLVGWKIDRII